MKTKKLYIAPSIEIAHLEPITLLAGSLGSNIQNPELEKDPFSAPQVTSIGTPVYFDSWDEGEAVEDFN